MSQLSMWYEELDQSSGMNNMTTDPYSDSINNSSYNNDYTNPTYTTWDSRVDYTGGGSAGSSLWDEGT